MVLLVAPLRLDIDSSKNKYLIKWSGIGSLTLKPSEEDWFLNLKIGFWKKQFLISRLMEGIWKKEKKKPEPEKRKKKRKPFSFFKFRKKALRVLKSFKVRQCKIDIDTDDYYWNALLIPVFQAVNKGNYHRVAINFSGKNSILLLIENRLIKILYSILI